MHHAAYKGFGCAQTVNFKEAFRDFFGKIKPSTVVEIGIWEGGTSLAINDLLKEVGHDYKMISYEKFGRESYSALEKEGINVRICDLFTDDYQNLNQENLSEIKENLQRSGTTVLMCDGGLKRMEVNLLTDLLKPGDFVMAHDYARTQQYFSEAMVNRVWNWCEITDADIQETIDRNKLEDYMRDEFQNVAWMCRRKPL